MAAKARKRGVWPKAGHRPHHHHLQRMDHRGFAGWVVRITRRNQLVAYRYFRDSSGGRRRTLAAAIAYRDQMLRALPPPTLEKVSSIRNTTGVVGMSVMTRMGRRGEMLRYYVSTWVWPPRSRHQVQKTFSVRKYGELHARALAIEARLAALERGAAEERRRLLAKLSRKRR